MKARHERELCANIDLPLSGAYRLCQASVLSPPRPPLGNMFLTATSQPPRPWLEQHARHWYGQYEGMHNLPYPTLAVG